MGKRPHSVVAADFDGDGVLDLATANEDSDDLSVLLGEGDGLFAPELRLKAGDGPVSLAAGDFDGDGLADLASANFSGGLAGDVSIFLSQGGGAFAPEERLPAGDGPVAVVAADFNGDAALDLVVANASSFDLSVFLGQGNGRFTALGEVALEEGPRALAVADFNGDDLLDLAVAENFVHRVSILLGDGEGGFGPETPFTSGSVPFSLAPGDFNGDGIVDLLVANSGSGDALGVMFGLGDGTLDPQVRFFAAGVNPVAVAVADLDGNGEDDLIAANSNSFDVSLLLNQGNAEFPEQPDANIPVGDGPNAVIAVDLDGDGRLDLVTSNSFTNDVTVLRGLGGVEFELLP